MYILGITGGIGSGKTAVSDRFQALGIDVVDADQLSRVVVEKGRPALNRIAEHFGASILTENGELNRAELRSKIFKDPIEKRWLENLLHPLIGEELMAQLAAAQSKYVILASPLLTESGQDALCDSVLVVDVPEALQLERTMKRDNNDAEQVKRIIQSQADRQTRLSKATHIIENTKSLDHLDKEVVKLHDIFIKNAALKNDDKQINA